MSVRRRIGNYEDDRGMASQVYGKLESSKLFQVMPPEHPLERVVEAEAACRFVPGFTAPVRGNSPEVRARQLVCASCPVKRECQQLGDHVEGNSTSEAIVSGVWGGESATQRIERRKARKVARAA